MAPLKLPALYPIVNVADPSPAACQRAYELAIELADAGATLLQLRAKTLSAGTMTEIGARLVEAFSGSPVQLVINDRADVAAACAAAGVHLGDEDVPVAVARLVLSAGRAAAGTATGGRETSAPIVGYSTHSVAEAAAASASGADYLGFGPVFESPTKAGVRDARGLALLAEACLASTLPVVALGGVTLEGAAACWRAGAASVAVINEIERSSDRRALVTAYRVAARQAGLV